MDDIQKATANVATIIANAKEDVLKEYKAIADNTAALEGRVTSDLNRLLLDLHHLAGTVPNIKTQSIADQFPPITKFMGEEITLPKKIKVEDLTPGEAERAIYVDKVTTLYSQIETMSPEGVLNSYTIPEDVLVLRGVAKKAGVEGYDEKPLNIPFIEEIVKGIQDKRNADAEQTKIDQQLSAQENKAPAEPAQTIEADLPNYKSLDERRLEHGLPQKPAGANVAASEVTAPAAQEAPIKGSEGVTEADSIEDQAKASTKKVAAHKSK